MTPKDEENLDDWDEGKLEKRIKVYDSVSKFYFALVLISLTLSAAVLYAIIWWLKLPYFVAVGDIGFLASAFLAYFLRRMTLKRYFRLKAKLNQMKRS